MHRYNLPTFVQSLFLPGYFISLAARDFACNTCKKNLKKFNTIANNFKLQFLNFVSGIVKHLSDIVQALLTSRHVTWKMNPFAKLSGKC